MDKSEFLTNEELVICINEGWDLFLKNLYGWSSAGSKTIGLPELQARDAQLSIIIHYLIRRKEAEKRDAI